MARHQMEDGTVVDTKNAVESWEEETYWDGHNMCSKATGSQWEHQTLYKSRKGRYYIEHSSAWQGHRDSAEWVSPQEAARWLLSQEIDLPADLEEYVEELTE